MSQTVRAAGIAFNVQIDGPEGAPWVVMSNSLMSTLHMWDPQVPALAARYRVLRYDTRGHGKTEVSPPPYTIDRLADDVVALMDALKIERAHFVGLSLGGMTGQRLGARHGDRLRSLVIADTAAQMPPESMWEDRVRMAETEGTAALVPATIDRWFSKPFQTDPAVERVREMIRTTPVPGFVGCCRAIQKMDNRPVLGQITVPTLVIVGENDPGTTVAAAQVLHQGIADSELVVIKDGLHLCNIEMPAPFNEALIGFLDRHAA